MSVSLDQRPVCQVPEDPFAEEWDVSMPAERSIPKTYNRQRSFMPPSIGTGMPPSDGLLAHFLTQSSAAARHRWMHGASSSHLRAQSVCFS